MINNIINCNCELRTYAQNEGSGSDKNDNNHLIVFSSSTFTSINCLLTNSVAKFVSL